MLLVGDAKDKIDVEIKRRKKKYFIKQSWNQSCQIA